MEKLVDILRGYAPLTVTGAFPEGLLNRCARAGVVFWDTGRRDDYSMTMTVRARDLKRVRDLALRSQCTLAPARRLGAPTALRRLRRRVALLLGLALCAGALFWSSLHIWEMEVTGNETVSETVILNALQDVGVGIGSFWPSFTSDNIRSEVLVRVPELAWITVNVRGSRGEVIVRERVVKPVVIDEGVPADVVASKAGIVTEVRVLRGGLDGAAGAKACLGTHAQQLCSATDGTRHGGGLCPHLV